MELQAIFTKTSRGISEVKNRSARLPRNLLNVLTLIDGKSTLDRLLRESKLGEMKFEQAISRLEEEGFIRVFTVTQRDVDMTPAVTRPRRPRPGVADGLDELDFSAIARSALEERTEGESQGTPRGLVTQSHGDSDVAATDIEARRIAEAALKAQAAAEAKAKAEEEARARAEAQARVEMEARARMAAEAEARAKAAARARLEAHMKVEAERKARTEAEQRAEEERRAREALEARLETERATRAEAEKAAREEAERRTREEADIRLAEEARIREEAERRAREAAERQAREELETRLSEERAAREEGERRAREQAEQRAREEMELKLSAERRTREDLEARLAAEQKAKEEAEKRAREAAENKAREEAERRMREEEERRAYEESERRAQEAFEMRLAAERKAREEAERRVQEEAALRQKEDAERRAMEEAERQAREEAERRAAEEAERRAQEEAQHRAREAAERKIREDLEAKLAAERKAREDAEQRAHEEAELRARMELEEAERQAQEEAERRMREEAERQARAEEALRQQEEVERRILQEAERQAAEEANARKEEEETERQAEADAQRLGQEDAACLIDSEPDHAESEPCEEAATPEREACAVTSSAPPNQPVQPNAGAPRPEVEASEGSSPEVSPAAPTEPILNDVVSLFQVDLAALDARERQLRQEEEEALRVEADRHAHELAGDDDPSQQEARDEVVRRTREAEEAARQIAEEADRAAQEEASRQQEKEESRRRQEEEQRAQEERTRQASAERAEREQRLREEAERRDREEAAARAEAETARKAEIKLQKKRAKEEERARKRADAEARKRAKAIAKAQASRSAKVAKTPAKWRKPVAISAVLFVLATIGLVHVVRLDSLVPGIERLVESAIGEPLQIGAMRAGLFPSPHFKLEGVVVGKEQDVRIASARAVPDWASIFSDRKVLSELELLSVTADGAVLDRLPKWVKPEVDRPLRAANVALREVKLVLGTHAMPPFDGDISLDATGGLAKAVLRSRDGKLTVAARNKSDRLEADFTGRGWTAPIGPGIQFDEIVGKAVVRGSEIVLSDLTARLYGGTATGHATVAWTGPWVLAGDFNASQLDLAATLKALTGQFQATGRLAASGRFTAQSAQLDGLFSEPSIEAGFKVERGEIDNMDLTRALQQAATGTPVRGGKTQFAELSGTLRVSQRNLQFRQLALSSGLLLATGSTEIVPTGDVAGRLSIELAAKPHPVRALVALSGRLSDLQLKAAR